MKSHASTSRPLRLIMEKNNATEVLDKLKNHLMTPRGLIGMPTETVYGLAANGLCEESVRHIFTVKGRPLTDPVILHVPSFLDALETIFDTSLYDAFVILLLAKRFSPGPITIISRGKSTVPAVVSANTMFPAVRCPSHPVTQTLLRHVGVPLAAPSANKFGHISPTTAKHVISEFPDEPILVLDAGSCHFGIESTVIKVEPSEDLVNANDFLRVNGATYRALGNIVDALELERLSDPSETDALIEELRNDPMVTANLIKAFMSHVAAFKDKCHQISILRRGFITEGDLKVLFKTSVFPNTRIVCVDMFSGVKEASVSPGTLLTHYAPSVPAYLVEKTRNPLVNTLHPHRIVMIDATGDFSSFKRHFLRYLQLDQDDEKVAHALYDTLRHAESVALAYNDKLKLNEYKGDPLDGSAIIIISHEKRDIDLNATVRDRIMRACSCKKVDYRIVSDKVEFLL